MKEDPILATFSFGNNPDSFGDCREHEYERNYLWG